MTINIENKLKEIIAKCGENVQIDKIDKNTNIIDVFRYTSINIIQLIVEIENEFDIEIDNDDLDMEKLANYSALLELIKNYVIEK